MKYLPRQRGKRGIVVGGRLGWVYLVRSSGWLSLEMAVWEIVRVAGKGKNDVSRGITRGLSG